MPIMSISEARRNLSKIVNALPADQAVPSDPVRISVRGKAKAVILSNAEYDQMRRRILDQEIDRIFEEFHDVNVALTNK